MDTLASSSRRVDMCNWCRCTSHVEASARLVAQHQSGEKENCPGTIEARLSAIQRGMWYLIQSCWGRAVAFGRVVPPRRAIAASSAPEGDKVRNVLGEQFLVTKS